MYFKNLVKEVASEKLYYSLFEFVPAQKQWGAQFGDYDKKVVQQEMQDMKESGTPTKHLLIVATKDSGGQKVIDEAAKLLNKRFPSGTKEKLIRYTGPGSEI